MILPSLPAEAVRLCEELRAPPLLIRHLTLVHAAAVELLDGLNTAFPGLVVDDEAVLLGASLHDLGKTLHPEELNVPGNKHEDDGPGLLQRHGVPPRLARFARTHVRWREVDELEDLLVSLSDSIWRGCRCDELESKVTAILAARTGLEPWQVWATMDAICEQIASRGEERLGWQRSV